MPQTGAWAEKEAAHRQLGKVVTVLASAARTVSSNTTFEGRWRRLFVYLDVTVLASILADKLDVYIDASPDGGTTWFNAGHFPQLAGDGSAAQHLMVLDPSAPGTSTFAVTGDAAAGAVRPWVMGNKMRARVVITNGGGTHSFTFSLFAFGQC